MATLVKEKSREKKKKGRQKRTPSPLTFANPGATTEDPPAVEVKFSEVNAAAAAPAVHADSPGPSTASTETPAVAQPIADRKNRPNRKNGRNRHDRAGIADQKAKQRSPEAASAAADASSAAGSPKVASLLEALEALKEWDACCAHVERTGAKLRLADKRVQEDVRRNLEFLRGSVQSPQWITHEEAERMFGGEPLECARRMRALAADADRGATVAERHHRLRAPLDNYWDNVRTVAKKEREMRLREEQCESAREALWTVEQKEQVARGKCADGARVELRARHAAAAWHAARAPAARLRHAAALDAVAADYCVHRHNALLNKYDLEEQLLAQLASGEESTRGALALLFRQLRAGGGGEGAARAALTFWTYSAAHALLSRHDSFGNTLLVLHHILGQVHCVRWALPLVQVSVTGFGDVACAFAALETVLNCSRLMEDEKEQVAEEPAEVWLEVQAEGGAVEASARDVRCALTERDLLALLRQLPVPAALRHMSLLRNDPYNRLSFNGDPSGGQAVLKAVCGARTLLSIVRQGLRAHAAYRSVCHWLCRLAHHTLHYIADLAEATRSEWVPHMEHVLPAQLECVFNTGWLVLEGGPHADMSQAYLAHLPFQMLSEESTSVLLEHMRSDLKMEDTVECYHRLSCIATMGQSRPYCDLTNDVATYLFHMGFRPVSGKMQCGAWARSLLARLMYSHPALFNVTLLLAAHQHAYDGTIEWEWLRALELHFWRPTVDVLRRVMRSFQEENPGILEPLVSSLQWGNSTRVPMEVQHALAEFVVGMARELSAERKATPEWMYQALIDLKLHRVEWQEELSGAPAPSESAFPEPASDADLATCVWTLLVTSWGHSLPLICEYGVPLVTRLARAGRCREAVHCLGYVMVVMTQSPESIEHTPSFKTLLSSLLAAGQSYTAMASRLLGRAPQTGQQLVEHAMRTHLLSTYNQLQHGSPRALLTCWMTLLTSAEEWASSAQHLTLLDTALGCCRLHRYALDAAHAHLRACLEKKAPSSGWSSLLTTGTLEGLVAAGAGPVAPYLWLASLRAEHECLERASGLWHRLLWQLHGQRDAKLSVDRALEQAGGPKSAEGLAIYRAATAVLATPLTHIMHIHLWELFFELFMDRPLDAANLTSSAEPFPPAGALFFRGLLKSRQLAQLRRRLRDTLEHHRALARPRADPPAPAASAAAPAGREPSPFASPGGNTEYSAESPERTDAQSKQQALAERASQSKSVLAYHEAVVKKVRDYICWLDEKASSPVRTTVSSDVDKTTNYPVLDTLWILHFDRDVSGGVRSAPRARVVHASPRKTAPWHSVVEETYTAPGPVERMLRRYHDHPDPMPMVPPPEPLRSLLPAGAAASPQRLLSEIDDSLKELVIFARQFGTERAALAATDCDLFELLPRLRVARKFRTSEHRGCGEQCTGPVQLTVEGEEWCVNEGAEREIADNRRRRRALFDALAAPRDRVAKVAARLTLMLRRMECESVACTMFDRLVACMGQLEECPPLRDTVNTLAVQLGERYISSNAERCAKLVLRDALPGGAALVNSLLEPRRLPPDHFPRLYADILRHRASPHSTFSHLSKFKVEEWRVANPDLSRERGDLINTILDALIKYGPEPSADDLVLLELLARHLELAVASPELGEAVARASHAAAAGRLPPFVWASVQRAVERCAADLRLADLSAHLARSGAAWWEARMRAAPSCSLGARAPHALPVARVLHAYARAALDDLKAVTPPIPMEIVAVSAWKAACEGWHAWLLAWWGERRELPEPLLPWGAGDEELATRALDVFLASVEMILAECPGGEGRLLAEVFRWLAEATWRPAGAACPAAVRHAHVLMTQLVRLPWTRHAWFHVGCLPTLVEVCSRDVECQMFAAVALRATRRWLPPELAGAEASRALGALLLALTRLPLPAETLEHATKTLPWEQLELEDFEPVLDTYFQSHTSTAPVHTKGSFPLVLAAATMNATMCAMATHAEYARASLAKRRALLARWARAAGEALAAGAADAVGAAAAETVACALRAVQETCLGNRNPHTLENSEECQETCEALLQCAAMTLCNSPLCDVSLQKWQEWVGRAPRVMLRAALRVVGEVTSRDCFVALSDALMRRYLRNGGTWEEVLSLWRGGSAADVEATLRARCLYAAYATMQQEVRARRSPARLLAVRALRALADAALDVKPMEAAVLMILCFIMRNLPFDHTNCANESCKSNSQCSSHSGFCSDSNNTNDHDSYSDNIVESCTINNDCSTISENSNSRKESTSDYGGSVSGEADIMNAEYWELTSSLLQKWMEPPRYQLLKKITLQSTTEFSERFRELCKLALYLVIAARRCAGEAAPGDDALFISLRREINSASDKSHRLQHRGLDAAAARGRRSGCMFELFCESYFPEHATLLALELQ